MFVIYLHMQATGGKVDPENIGYVSAATSLPTLDKRVALRMEEDQWRTMEMNPSVPNVFLDLEWAQKHFKQLKNAIFTSEPEVKDLIAVISDFSLPYLKHGLHCRADVELHVLSPTLVMHDQVDLEML